jgi:hypothetical protein
VAERLADIAHVSIRQLAQVGELAELVPTETTLWRLGRA